MACDLCGGDPIRFSSRPRATVGGPPSQHDDSFCANAAADDDDDADDDGDDDDDDDADEAVCRLSAACWTASYSSRSPEIIVQAILTRQRSKSSTAAPS